MAPLRTARQRAPRPFEGSRASPEEDGEEERKKGGGGGDMSAGGEEGARAEDGFDLEEVLRLGGTKQDFIMLAGLGDPEELLDGGKKGAIDDLKPGELHAFIQGLGLGRFPESCRLQEDEAEEAQGEGAPITKKGAEGPGITRSKEAPGLKKGGEAPAKKGAEGPGTKKGGDTPAKKVAEGPGSTTSKEAPGPKKGENHAKKGTLVPSNQRLGAAENAGAHSLESNKVKRAKKDLKKPLQLNEVSSTSEAARKPARQDTFEYNARPILLVKPGGKWYDMDYAKEVTSEPQDGAQVSNYKALAQKLYQHEADLYKSKKDVQKGASYAWMKTVVSAGTLADRMAAMTLLIQDAPIHTLQFIESLVNLIRKKGSRRQCMMALDTLKELLLSDLLPDHRKLVTFTQHPFDKMEKMSSGNRDARDRRLILWYFEHQLKHQVAEFVQVLETLSHDTLLATKARALTVAHELLCTKPEEEKALLVQLINKLGDPQYRIATKACYLMETLLQKHPNMKGVVCHEVERLLYRPNISSKAQYYGICFLNQTILSHEESDLANKLITVYFCFFRTCIKKKDMESKMLRALLTGVNRAFPYAQIGNEKVTEQLNTLFKIVHLVNFNTSVQVFMLLFQVMDSQQTVSHRYYAALYKKLLDPGLAHCSKQSMFLNLVYKSLKADVEMRRVKAFVKRLLQVTCGSMAPFICGALYLVSEILKLKPGLRALLQEQGESDEEEHFKDVADDDVADDVIDHDQEEKKDEIKGEDSEGSTPAASWVHLQTLKGGTSSSIYDPLNRNPLFCGADCTSLWELKKLSEHFHPSVAHFAKTILEGSSIQYTGDPLQDFTLMRFLDRFVYRNPKLQKFNENSRSVVMRPKKKLFMNNVQAHAVNSKEFLDREESQIPVEEVFFHRFYRKLANEKKKQRRHEDEECVEDVDDDEFEKVLDLFEGDHFGAAVSEDLDFASNVSNNPKGNKKNSGGEAGSSSDSDYGDDDVDLDDEVISLGSMDEEDFGEDVSEEAGAFVDLQDDDDDDDHPDVSDKPSEASMVGSKIGKRKRSESRPPVVSKERKKGFKGDSRLSAAAEEFGFLLDEHSGAKFDNIGMNAMANKDNASLKQLKWEADRDSWLHKKDLKRKKFNQRKPHRKLQGKRK